MTALNFRNPFHPSGVTDLILTNKKTCNLQLKQHALAAAMSTAVN